MKSHIVNNTSIKANVFGIIELTALNQRVDYVLVKWGFKTIFLGAILNIISALWLTWKSYIQTDYVFLLIIWCGIMLTVNLFNACVSSLYFYYKPSIENSKFWRSIRRVLIVLVSIAYSSMNFLVIPLEISQQYIMLFFFYAVISCFILGELFDFIAALLTLSILLIPPIAWPFIKGNYFIDFVGNSALNFDTSITLALYGVFMLFVALIGYNFVKRYIEREFILENMNIQLEHHVALKTSELKTAKEDAEAANRAKTEFLGIVSHELRTPLRVIGSGANGLQKHFLKLIEAYQLAKTAKLPVPYITPQQFELIPSLLDGIEKETDAAFNFIKMLLSNLGKMGDAQDSLHVSMSHCIETALSRYPFAEGEKERVKWRKDNDFSFMGNEVLMVHVLFNLLKNALQYIEEASKGEIDIWVDSKESNNILHFKDTAKGIPADILPHIFDRYYSKSQGGTGIGLAFCRMIVTSFGGTISCESVDSVYTEFLLILPVVNS